MRTWSPLRTGSASILPPISGLSAARRRVFTVPALLLVTLSSTRPGATLKTVTGMGSLRSSVIRTNAPPARIMATTTARRRQGGDMGTYRNKDWWEGRKRPAGRRL